VGYRENRVRKEGDRARDNAVPSRYNVIFKSNI
jgi:hypothetical protein